MKLNFFKYQFYLALVIFQTAIKANTFNYILPKQSAFSDYYIIDSVDKNKINIKLNNKNKKIAIVLRDIGTTAYSYIYPQFNNKIIQFNGSTNCCRTKTNLLGNSGLIVYQFELLKSEPTTIKIIARHKGLSEKESHFNSDNSIEISIN